MSSSSVHTYQTDKLQLFSLGHVGPTASTITSPRFLTDRSVSVRVTLTLAQHSNIQHQYSCSPPCIWLFYHKICEVLGIRKFIVYKTLHLYATLSDVAGPNSCTADHRRSLNYEDIRGCKE